MPTPSSLAGVNSASVDTRGPVSGTQTTSGTQATISPNLFERFRAGDPNALRAVTKGHYSRLHRIALHLGHDVATADAVVAETFVRTFQARKSLDPSMDLWASIARIGIHLLLAAPRGPAPLEYGDDPRLSTVAAFADLGRTDIDSGLYCALAQAVSELPDSLRVVVVLSAIDRSSFDEIGAIVGASESAVGLRLHEARRAIREKLAAQGVLRVGETS